MKSFYAVIFGLFVFGANAQNVEKHHPVKPGQNQHHYQDRYQHNNYNRHNHYDRHNYRPQYNQYNNYYYYQPARPVYPAYQPRYYQPYNNYYYAPQPIIIERGNRDWVAPLIGGVILGTVISEANRNYYYGY